MAGPALGPTGNTSGLGAASPAQGQMGLIGMLANAVTPEALAAAQQKKSETEAAIFQAAQAKREALLNAIQNDPSLAGSKGMLRQTQQAYQGTGIQPPIQQGQNGPQVSAAGLGGESLPAWFQKNQAQILATPQGSRAQLASVSGIPLTPQQAQQLDALPYIPTAATSRVQETAQKDYFDQSEKRLEAALKPPGGGPPNMAMVKAAVDSYKRDAAQYGLDPNQMDSYLDTAITEMTPMEKARLRMEISKGNLNDETTVRMQTLLGPQTQYLQAHIDEVKAITNSTNSLVGPKTKQLLGTYEDAIAHAGLATEQADYYAQKVQTGVAMGGLNGPELGDAVKAFTEGMKVQTSLIQTAEATKRSLMGNTNYSIPGSGRDQIQHQIQQIDTQEGVYRSRLNGYQSQLQSLVGGIQGPAQGGTQPPGQNPSGNKPPASDPPTQMHNGKMYYLHPDGKYYTAPPQAGQ